MNYDQSSLAPTANEFVPGGGVGGYGFVENGLSDGQDFSSNAFSMNSGAQAWIPPVDDSPFADVTTGYGEGIDETYGYQSAAISDLIEPMVEVSWGGSTYTVPQSMTYADADGNLVYTGPIEEPGLQWANGSHTVPAPPKRCLRTIGIPEPIREHFQSLDIEALRQMPPDDPRYQEIPLRYHSAYPLDVNLGPSGGSFGYPSSVYKVIDRADSQVYVLRRYDNARTTKAIVDNAVAKWANTRHPGIVSLYNITAEKGAVFFTYAYHPAALTLRQRFIDQRGALLSEALMWRILVQLILALRMVHSRGLAARVIDPVHVILTSGTCARINCLGIPDILEFESRKKIDEMQAEDLIKLGRLMLALATRSIITAGNTESAIALLQQSFSPELHGTVLNLLVGKTRVGDLCHMIGDKIQDELDTAMAAADALHSNLRNEYENGRLLRLLIKLGFVNERPDDELTPGWSETGDRYILKLFRDYVFHQNASQSDGRIAGQVGPCIPVLDAGHVLTALNKLDTSDTEEMLLSSRDNKDLLVLSFADVQRLDYSLCISMPHFDSFSIQMLGKFIS